MKFSIRPAGPDDAEAIVVMRMMSWRQAYRHLLPEEFFARQETDHYPAMVERRRRHLAEGANQPHRTRTWIALDEDGEVIGVAVSGPGRDADLAGEIPLELQMIYVLARAHGTGAAQALLDEAVGAETCFLWIFRQNPRAERFYRRNGFSPDGAAKQADSVWHHLDEYRMVRR